MSLFARDGVAAQPVGVESVRELTEKAEQLKKNIVQQEDKARETGQSVKRGSWIPGRTAALETQWRKELDEVGAAYEELRLLEEKIKNIQQEEKEKEVPPSYEEATTEPAAPTIAVEALETPVQTVPSKEEVVQQPPLPSYQDAVESQEALQEEKRQAQELSQRKKQREAGKAAAEKTAEIARQREEERQKKSGKKDQAPQIKQEISTTAKQVIEPEKTSAQEKTSTAVLEGTTGKTTGLSTVEKAELENVEHVRKKIEREKRLIAQLNEELESSRQPIESVPKPGQVETEVQRLERDLREQGERSARAERERRLRAQLDQEQERLKILEKTWKSFTPDMKKRAEQEVVAQATKSQEAKKVSKESVEVAKRDAKDVTPQEIETARELKKALEQNKTDITKLESSIKKDEQLERDRIEMQKKQEAAQPTAQATEEITATEQGFLGKAKKAAQDWLEGADVSPEERGQQLAEKKAQQLTRLNQLQEKQKQLKQQWSETKQGKMELSETRELQRIVNERVKELEKKDREKIFEEKINVELAEKLKQKKAAAEKEAAEKKEAEAQAIAQRRAAEAKELADKRAISVAESIAAQEKAKRDQLDQIERERVERRAEEKRKLAEKQTRIEGERILLNEMKKQEARFASSNRKKSLSTRIQDTIKKVYADHPSYAKYMYTLMHVDVEQLKKWTIAEPKGSLLLQCIRLMTDKKSAEVESLLQRGSSMGRGEKIPENSYETFIRSFLYAEWIARLKEEFSNAELYDYLFKQQDEKEQNLLGKEEAEDEKNIIEKINAEDTGIQDKRVRIRELRNLIRELKLYKIPLLQEKDENLSVRLREEEKRWFGQKARGELRGELQGIDKELRKMQDELKQLEQEYAETRQELQKKINVSSQEKINVSRTEDIKTEGQETTSGKTNALTKPGIAARFKAFQFKKLQKPTTETEQTTETSTTESSTSSE